MGVDINRTIAITFLIGGAWPGRPAWSRGVLRHIRSQGFQAGLKAFTAAVLGGIGNIDRCGAGRLHHRLRRGGRRNLAVSAGPRPRSSPSSS